MERAMKYPVGIQDFERIRKGGYVYVDKTALMRQLIDSGDYYFLSRPRRFGKSLLLSTLAAYFEGKQDLFKGLTIAEQTETDKWPEYPVFHLDLSGKEYNEYADLIEQLDWNFKRWSTRYGAIAQDRSVEKRFATLIDQVCEVKQRQVVILVDEYDKPLLETVGNKPLHDRYRSTLRAVYSNLKVCGSCIRFAMLTGVTKFSKLSIFSDLNNLEDISMDSRFATLCGITERELMSYFSSGLQELAKANNLTLDEVGVQLKRRYDGYLFEEKTERVYNPFSLLNTLNKRKFKDYWSATGMPNFLVDMLNQEHFDLANLPNEAVDTDVLDALDTLESNPLPILYQSGYLTIDHCDDKGDYFLRFPNEEVERSFLKQLLPKQLAKKRQMTHTLITRMVDHIRGGQPEAFMEELQALLADIPYERGKPGEVYFRNLLFTIFRLVGFSCEVEHPVSAGRTDVVIKTDRFIYVLELKVDKSVEAALRQIEEKGYAAPYATDKRKLFKIGVNFSSAKKRIDTWQIVGA